MNSKSKNHTSITVYTDGSCIGNPGKGGWAFIYLENNTSILEVSGGEKMTTNNRMELTAIVEALKFMSDKDNYILYSDSMYSINGITKWMENWKRKGWSGVKNSDIWKQIDILLVNKSVSWNYVKAHNGQIWNEKVDKMARNEAKN